MMLEIELQEDVALAIRKMQLRDEEAPPPRLRASLAQRGEHLDRILGAGRSDFDGRAIAQRVLARVARGIRYWRLVASMRRR